MFIVCLKKFSIAFVWIAERYKKGGKKPLDENVFGSECTVKKFVRKAVMKEKTHILKGQAGAILTLNLGYLWVWER